MAGAGDDLLLSVANVARLLSVTESTVRVWIKEGTCEPGARFWRLRRRGICFVADHQSRAGRGGCRLKSLRSWRWTQTAGRSWESALDAHALAPPDG